MLILIKLETDCPYFPKVASVKVCNLLNLLVGIYCSFPFGPENLSFWVQRLCFCLDALACKSQRVEVLNRSL